MFEKRNRERRKNAGEYIREKEQVLKNKQRKGGEINLTTLKSVSVPTDIQLINKRMG